MDTITTCGQGLAEHSALPAKLAELIGALAETLQRHTGTLDAADESARAELAVYRDLAGRFGWIAGELQEAAQRVAAQRDAPMGRHDEKALLDPSLMVPFREFVRREEELLLILQRDLKRERAMLGTS